MLATFRRHTQRHPAFFMLTVVIVCFAAFTFIPTSTLFESFVQNFVLGVFILGCLFLWNPSACEAPSRPLVVFTARKTMYLLVIALILGIVSALLAAFFEPTFDLTQLRYLPFLVLICLFTGIFEEGLFRGLVFPLFAHELKAHKHGVVVAALFSALLFGALHVSNLVTADVGNPIVLGQALAKTLQASLFGFFMAAIFLKTNNIWPIALVHGLYNLFALWPTLLFPGSQATTYLTGSSADLMVLIATTILFAPLAFIALHIFYEPTSSD